MKERERKLIETKWMLFNQSCGCHLSPSLPSFHAAATVIWEAIIIRAGHHTAWLHKVLYTFSTQYFLLRERESGERVACPQTKKMKRSRDEAVTTLTTTYNNRLRYMVLPVNSNDTIKQFKRPISEYFRERRGEWRKREKGWCTFSLRQCHCRRHPSPVCTIFTRNKFDVIIITVS